MSHHSYYALLGLGQQATTAQIESACQQMRRLYQSAGGNAAKLAELDAAHATLTDAARRAEYDAQLPRAAAQRATPQSEPGKGLRWLAVLGAPMLLVGGMVWWAQRPPAVRPVPVPAAPAGQGEPASSGSAGPAKHEDLLQTKYLERSDLQSHQFRLEQQLTTLNYEIGVQGPGPGTAEQEARKDRLEREIAWSGERISQISEVEIEEARQGNLLPAQRFPG